MKQNLKFGLLLVLALLIHCATNGAMEDMCKVSSPTYRQEKCYVSQDCPIQNALERLYNLYATQSCDMSHTDVTHVPTNKSVLLPVAFSRRTSQFSKTVPLFIFSSPNVLLWSYLLLYIWVKKDSHLAYSTVDSFTRHLLQLVLFSTGRID